GSIPLKVTNASGQISITAGTSSTPLGINAGELGSILDAYNTKLPGYLSSLDTLAGALVSTVNTIHAGGYGLGAAPSTGVAFFTGTTAASIGVNAAVANNPSLVAASSDGSPGDNKIALALADAGQNLVLQSNTASVADYYNGFVGNLGTAIKTAQNSATSQGLILAQLQNQRSSVSGVSIDEEMVKMIQYQRAYQASARVVTSADELMRTILQMV
ncbi:MAG: hypothetical protein HY966_02565, partial [Ignavibacteriales bacterium]|nr:hypothetical protein [Ignavibacteriales bacterium]